MSVREIEQAITQLKPDELKELSTWLLEYHGTKPRQSLLDLVGTISPSDLEIMSREIESGCENVDPQGW